MDKINHNYGEIYLAGGCFWGVEAYLNALKGVVDTCVGFANGHTKKPSYEEVCTGLTGHAETVYVKYDKNEIGLDVLLQHFFSVINPVVHNRQGNDCGEQYRSGIYYKGDNDLQVIKAVRDEVQKGYKKKIVTEIMPLQYFYPAEDNHQKYLEKNPNGYCHINLSVLKNDPMAKIIDKRRI